MRKFWKYITKEQFSYVDLVLVYFAMQLIEWVLSHLHWS